MFLSLLGKLLQLRERLVDILIATTYIKHIFMLLALFSVAHELFSSQHNIFSSPQPYETFLLLSPIYSQGV